MELWARHSNACLDAAAEIEKLHDVHCMTNEEREVVLKLAAAWNAFVSLPIEHDDDINEFRHGVHAPQEKVLARPARRATNAIEEASAEGKP